MPGSCVLVLSAVCSLNVCPGIIATIPREMLTVAFNLPQGGCLGIGDFDLIPKGMGDIPPPIVSFVAGFVKHLPHV